MAYKGGVVEWGVEGSFVLLLFVDMENRLGQWGFSLCCLGMHILYE